MYLLRGASAVKPTYPVFSCSNPHIPVTQTLGSSVMCRPQCHRCIEQIGLRSYIPAMAHNNGMMPRQGRGGRGKGGGFSDNAAKFRAAADAVPIEPAGT